VKRATHCVVAVQVDLETPGFTYKKWSDTQTRKPGRSDEEAATHYGAGDYLVYNQPDGGDADAVVKDAFERMYELS